MTDPFRGPAFACPDCGHGLRELGKRLVCDGCSGMMITFAELQATISDQTNAPTELTFATSTGTGKACPRCEREVVAATMTLSSNVEVSVEARRCERDGLWFGAGALVELFVAVSRRLNPRGENRGGNSGGTGIAVVGLGGAGRNVGLFRPLRPKRPTRPAYASPLEGQVLACPACREIDLRLNGERWECRACAGAFVEDAVLVGMMATMTGAPWAVPVVDGAPGDRVCPVCATPMTAGAITGVEVDRCATDGTWFDSGELAKVLAAALE